MKGDFSRFSFDPKKHYTGVWMQQGRLITDSDWNEELSIRQHLERQACIDQIGAEGAAIRDGGEPCWECTSCGYLHDGLTAPAPCPGCKQSGQDLFSQVDDRAFAVTKSPEHS